MNVLPRAVFLLCFALSPVFGQTVGASLQGTIHDPSGAVVPGAEVEIRNVETGATRILKTDEGGRWREPVLLPGEYELRVSLSGFQTIIRKGIHLAVGQDAVIDVRLELGRTGSEINVVADAERINLTSGSLSGLVDEKQMRDLPLNGRSFQQLALLEPGVNAVTAGGNDPVGGRTPKISMNGTRPEHGSPSSSLPILRTAPAFRQVRSEDRKPAEHSSRPLTSSASGHRLQKQARTVESICAYMNLPKLPVESPPKHDDTVVVRVAVRSSEPPERG